MTFRTLIFRLAVILGAVAFASCSDRSAAAPDMVPVETEPAPILFSAGVTKSDVSSLSEFYCSCFRGDYYVPVFQDVTFTFFENIFFGGQYWPSDDLGYKFFASNQPLLGDLVFSMCAQAHPEGELDLVVASTQNAQFRQVNNLEFLHVTVKLGRFTVTAPNGYRCIVDDGFITAVNLEYGGWYYPYYETWSNCSPCNLSFGEECEWEGGKSFSSSSLYFKPGSCRFAVAYELELLDGSATTGRREGTFEVPLQAGVVSNVNVMLPDPNLPMNISVSLEPVPWENGESYVEKF